MSIIQLTQTMQIMPTAYLRPGKNAMQPALPGMEMEQDEKPMVTNRQIAEVLASIANLLEFQNSTPIAFRPIATPHAAYWNCTSQPRQ